MWRLNCDRVKYVGYIKGGASSLVSEVRSGNG